MRKSISHGIADSLCRLDMVPFQLVICLCVWLDCVPAEHQERSNLHLRLFKLVFGSVSLYPTENEHMLKVIHQVDIEIMLKVGCLFSCLLF